MNYTKEGKHQGSDMSFRNSDQIEGVEKQEKRKLKKGEGVVLLLGRVLAFGREWVSTTIMVLDCFGLYVYSWPKKCHITLVVKVGWENREIGRRNDILGDPTLV